MLAVLAVLALTPAVSDAAYTIRIGEHGLITQLGAWSMSSPSLRSAEQAFGTPTSQRPHRPGFAGGPVADCEAAWSNIGLHVVFSTLGIEPGSCNQNKVIWIGRITSKKWQTWHGLRIGDASTLALRRHPWASLHQGIWWLASTVVPWGDQSRVPTVTATVRHGRISGFRLWVQAQGE